MRIPVAMCFNEGYTMPTCVAVYSALKSKKSSTDYAFYFITRDELSSDKISWFDQLKIDFPGTEVTNIVVGDILDNARVMMHFSVETYYRLLIAELLPDIDKCIYLDCDVLVLSDLTDMYQFNLGDNILAATRIWGGTNNQKLLKQRKADQTVCAGTMVIDLNKVREENITEKFISLVTDEKLEFADQDILNMVCYDRIAFLPLKYGIFGGHREAFEMLQQSVYTIEEVQEAKKDPAIIHYISKWKPWNVLDDDALSYFMWYKFAEASPAKYDHTQHYLDGGGRADLIAPQYVEVIGRYKKSARSHAYRIGKIITFVPEKIVRFIQKSFTK